MSLVGACVSATLLAAPRAALGQQAGSTSGPSSLNTLTPAERAAGWRLLFDGRTTAGRRGRKMDSMPSGWEGGGGTPKRVNAAADRSTPAKCANLRRATERDVA